jgi:two-component system cell cycle response regulator DivK
MTAAKKKVMVVEDNELNQRLFHDLLEISGADVVATRDGTNVMDMARTENPDLILMDINLPQISGVELTLQLKADQDLKHIPIIAVTAYAMKGDEDKIREGGCEDYITKPISVPLFLAKIKQYLGETPPQS